MIHAMSSRPKGEILNCFDNNELWFIRFLPSVEMTINERFLGYIPDYMLGLKMETDNIDY